MRSDVQVHDVFRVLLDPLAPGLHVLAHENGEDLVGLNGVVQSDAAQGAGLRVHGGLPQLVGVHLAETFEAGDVHLRVLVVGSQLGGDAVALLVGVGHLLGLAAGELVKRRHSRIYIAVLNERAHVAEEEGQQQRADMAAVHIGIGHDDDLVIAELFDIELIPDAGAEGHDEGIELVVAVDLVGARLFDIEHFAPHGEDGLEAGVAALDGGACGGIALDDVDLAEAGVALVAVLELVRHLPGLKPGLAADGISCLSCRLAGTVCHEGLVEDGLGDLGVLLKIGGELVVDQIVHQGADIGVAELLLGLALKLRLGVMTAEMPSRTSSPETLSSPLMMLFFWP